MRKELARSRRPALPSDAEIAAAVQAALDRTPENVTRLPGGANNVVARVTVDDRALAAKIYFMHPGDARDRLNTEFTTLSFLWRNGLRSIPEPVALDREHRIALYEFIEGAHVVRGEVGWTDVVQLADLLTAMWRLRTKTDAAQLPDASEAFLTVRAHLAAMDGRLERLRAALEGLADAQAQAFVEQEVVARVGRVGRFVEEHSVAVGVEVDRELPRDKRTLSPADFGFHNVLRRTNGRLAFLDFEYAGWDDPAVVFAQACVAPKVPLVRAWRLPLLRHLLSQFGDDGGVTARLRVIYPLVALKWSLIMLNEFLPVAHERRAFAGAGERAWREAQIVKCRQLLQLVDETTDAECFLDRLLRPLSNTLRS